MTGTYNTSVWLVQDIGPVKIEGSMDMPRVELLDTIELVLFVTP